jgi:hypothetical protein
MMTAIEIMKLLEAIRTTRLAVLWHLANFDAAQEPVQTNTTPSWLNQQDGHNQVPRNPDALIDG